jgi:hypothetical protein
MPLTKLENHDIAKWYQDRATEEGDSIEESKGVISWEKPNRASLDPVFFIKIEQMTFPNTGLLWKFRLIMLLLHQII